MRPARPPGRRQRGHLAMPGQTARRDGRDLPRVLQRRRARSASAPGDACLGVGARAALDQALGRGVQGHARPATPVRGPENARTVRQRRSGLLRRWPPNPRSRAQVHGAASGVVRPASSFNKVNLTRAVHPDQNPRRRRVATTRSNPETGTTVTGSAARSLTTIVALMRERILSALRGAESAARTHARGPRDTRKGSHDDRHSAEPKEASPRTGTRAPIVAPPTTSNTARPRDRRWTGQGKHIV